jgi:hypothetical protein
MADAPRLASQGSFVSIEDPPLQRPPLDGKASQSAESNPPPYYHNWEEVVPDTSAFPPPPVWGFLCSSTANASRDDAERAHDFCNSTPLWKPAKPPVPTYRAAQAYDFRPVQPPEFRGTLTNPSTGRWKGESRPDNGDCVLLTHLPLYFPSEDSPFTTKREKTIYFEVKLLSLTKDSRQSSDASGFSIGFVAKPYPTWRSPGWERGSVGVFSDDGCRFVNDSYGGKGFTTAFRVGETIGLGMSFSSPKAVASSGPGALHVEIFLTRDGREAGRWDLHEEADEEAGSVEGLEGDFDLYGAVGLFGGVKFDILFDKARWLWQPPV